MTALRRTAVAGVVSTYVLVTLGGLVRATESGLGCPDWPRCHGRLVPPNDFHARIEFSHRLVASVVIGLSVALAVLAWRHARHRPAIRRPALATVPLVLAQAGLGAVVVLLELHAESVVAHLALAMTLFALLLLLTANLFADPAGGGRGDPVLVRSGVGVAVLVLGIMLLGSYVSGRNAGLAFGDWPLFDGQALPIGRGTLGHLHGIHRMLAGVGGFAVWGLTWWTHRRGAARVTTRLLVAASVVYAAQVLLGAANVWTDLSSVTRTAHLAGGAAVFGLVVSATLTLRGAPSATAPSATASSVEALRELAAAPPRRPLARVGAYVRLTKPRVVELLLVTTVPAMVLAHGGMPSIPLIGAVLLGGALAAGGANTINCYIDRERDAEMRRTARRPLPTGEVTPLQALRFGVVLEAVAFVWLWTTANLLAASLALAATVFYVFVYSIWLKPRTAQNIVIGGAAGAVPVLVGWAAVTRDLASPAWVLFAIIFVWTPPHFWALAMRYRDDYAAAGVPMLPVVAGDDATTRQILVYAVVVVGATLLLQPVADLGVLYLAVAVGLGAGFVWRAVRLRLDTSPGQAMQLFAFSNIYLALLFGAVAADVLIRAQL
jgi:protoheme IX farnesyltransferase